MIDEQGHVVDASPKALLDDSVLSKRQLAAATHHQHTIEQTVPTRANGARLLVGTETVGVNGSSWSSVRRSISCSAPRTSW